MLIERAGILHVSAVALHKAFRLLKQQCLVEANCVQEFPAQKVKITIPNTRYQSCLVLPKNIDTRVKLFDTAHVTS